MSVKPGGHIYFMGIGGTGMAAVAGLCQQAGYKITGSDAGIYPPMSTMLEELKIKALSPYAAQNFSDSKADMVVVANVLSRGNVELEALLSSKTPYTSYPQLLGDLFLKNSQSVVIAGTHGKTTTTSLMAHVLTELGQNPGYMIGGIPKNFPRSFALGKPGGFFAIEGDEYDTAFFDKGPKFLHYHPKFLILNNLEFDHADIYKNLAQIAEQFEKLCRIVGNPQNIIANMDDVNIADVVKKCGLADKVTRVSTLGHSIKESHIAVVKAGATVSTSALPQWQVTLKTRLWGELNLISTLSGRHNMANIAQVVACLEQICSEHRHFKWSAEDLAKAFASFKGVARRLDHLGGKNGIDVYEDFAHHPTAIREVIMGFRQSFPNRRLVVAFEPRNATSRRNTFQDDFADSLALADLVYIGKCPVDLRIPENERMNTRAMQEKIGAKAAAFDENSDLLNELQKNVRQGDAVVFMSSGSFSGIQYQLPELLRGSK